MDTARGRWIAAPGWSRFYHRGPWDPGIAFAAFAEDGNEIVYSQEHDIYSIRRDGSAQRKLLTRDHFTSHFRFSRGSHGLRFTQFDPLGEEDSIMSASADGNRVVKLVAGCCGEWTPDRRYYLFSESFSNGRSDLWALPERRGFFSPGRKPALAQLTAGPLDFRFPLPARFSNTVFAVGTEYHAELVRYDKGRGEFTPFMHGISAVGLAFSQDGQWVADATFPDRVLWRSSVDGTEALQLTSPPMRANMPRWSPDGKQILFSGDAPGQTMNIFVVSAAGGAAEHLVPGNQVQLDPDWSPDGKSLVFGTFSPTPRSTSLT